VAGCLVIAVPRRPGDRRFVEGTDVKIFGPKHRVEAAFSQLAETI
jgi:hypothetical protein